MVVQSADEAISNANRTTTNDVGMCLWYTQEWCQTPHMYPDATAQWEAAVHKHPGDRNPPRGAPVSWTGGSSGHGHSALSLGGGMIRTIDQQSSGKTNDVPLEEIEDDWGLAYKGWHEDLGGVDLPYLRGSGTPQNPNNVDIGDLCYTIAEGGLIARDAPGGNDTGTSLPYGSEITVAELKDGWARSDEQVITRAAPADLVPVLDTDYLLGADVSSHQANWAGLADDEFYCWVKSTEGTSYINPEHDDQVAKIRAEGKVVGHYHWLVAGKTQDQLDYFFDHTDIQPGDMIALDWEDSSQPSCAEKDQWIEAALDRVDGANRVGLYCNRDWWINRDVSSYYGDYLWIANYTTDDDPGISAPWLFWQYTSEPYDQNRGRFADLAALKIWAGCDDQEPEPPTTEGLWYSSDYLYPVILPDPANPNGIKNGDHVEVTASGGLKARTLPGGPESLDKNGNPLIRDAGYEFDVTDDLVNGWVTGGTNWYSSDYLAVCEAEPPPTKPGWNTTPKIILPMDNVPGSVSYLQAGVRVAPVDDHPECWIVAQDYENEGDRTRFGLWTPQGALVEGMSVKNGGHAQTFHAYRSAAGNLYLWTLIDEYAYRIKWAPGKTVDQNSSGVEKMAYGKARPVGTFEHYIGFRSASDTQETLSIHDRFGFTDPDNNSADPIHKITINKRTDYTQQSWAVSFDRIYRIYGKTNETPGSSSGKHIVDVLDWQGNLLTTLDIRNMYRSGCDENEPEGLTFTGEPGNVLAGMREGPASASKRDYVWWTLTGLP